MGISLLCMHAVGGGGGGMTKGVSVSVTTFYHVQHIQLVSCMMMYNIIIML